MHKLVRGWGRGAEGRAGCSIAREGDWLGTGDREVMALHKLMRRRKMCLTQSRVGSEMGGVGAGGGESGVYNLCKSG